MKPVDIQRTLPQAARILDVGCYDFKQWQLSQSLNRADLHHAGVDYCQPSTCPPGFDFHLADLNRDRMPFADDSFDLVVASHVIEHLEKPVDFFADCVRVCKPGGFVYVECPSERTLMVPGFPFEHDKFYSTSFFDDPTHVGRPFSAQSFVRLARYHGCQPVKAGYNISWLCRLLAPVAIPFALVFRKGWLLEHIVWNSVGWASYIMLQKPLDVRGQPPLNYYIPSNRNDDWLVRLLRKFKKTG